MAGTVKLEDKQRLAQEEESEAKRLAIMMMKKREKYLYNKIDPVIVSFLVYKMRILIVTS